jgi:hypothetical protein
MLRDYCFVAKAAVRQPEKWAARVAAPAWQPVAGARGVRVAAVPAGDSVGGVVCGDRRLV